VRRAGLTLPAIGQYGVGMVFLPKEPASRMACVQEIERAIAERGPGAARLARRSDPQRRLVVAHEGSRALDPPGVHRARIGDGPGRARAQALHHPQEIRHAIQALKLRHGKEFYVPSMSTRTLVYKGMLLAHQVGEYYVDLNDETMVSALAMVHQRFSTNTFPTWDLAHPFRLVCHNGEINTLRGNVNWIRARQQAIASTVLGEDLDKIWPLIYDGQSDSASFDNALELLLMGGYPLAHAMMLMIPEAWAGNPLMDEDRRAFYEYHAALMEPWDGPGRDGVHRRPPDRRDARSQRAAARALRRHRRRLHRHGERGRRARHPRAQDRQEVAAAAGQDAARRHAAGPDHRRRRAEAHARDAEALPRVDCALADRARRAAGARAA
jgi:glutamate synthase domain-containing protein 1